MNDCNGNGRCLTIDYGNDMYYWFPSYKCKHNCKPVQCINYEFCGQTFKDVTKTKMKCDDCTHIWEGNDPVLFNDGTNCQICTKFNESYVKLPNCVHRICTWCYEIRYTKWIGGTGNEENADFYANKGQFGICAVCDRDNSIFYWTIMYNGHGGRKNIVQRDLIPDLLKLLRIELNDPDE